MIKVEDKGDGSFDISWDENDPIESKLNTWSEQDFVDAIMSVCNKTIKDELEEIAKVLGGTLSHYVCSDKNNEHQKYVIEYGSQRKG